uniref:Uncharacterized protein n=1 Tax=Anguilla anguilla TaxID=7936 RepID=A0A0E9X6I9_ANGAN
MKLMHFVQDVVHSLYLTALSCKQLLDLEYCKGSCLNLNAYHWLCSAFLYRQKGHSFLSR